MVTVAAPLMVMAGALVSATVIANRFVGAVEIPETSVATQLMAVLPIGNVLPEYSPPLDAQLTVTVPPLESDAAGFVY